MLKTKIIYTLRIHIQLQLAGFVPLMEMKNPRNPNFTCWIYENTPEFNDFFEKILQEGSEKRYEK